MSKFLPEDKDVFHLGVRDEFWFRIDSDINFIPEVEIENARQRAAVWEESNSSSDADEPLADEAWMARYEQELKTNEELEIKLNGRLDSSVAVSEW